MLSIKHFYWDVGSDVEGSHTLHLLVFLLCPSRLLMESYHRHATSWLLILVINVFAASKLWLIVTIMCIIFCCFLGSKLKLIHDHVIRFEKSEGKQFSISDADYFVFHSPYNKVWLFFLLWQHTYISSNHREFFRSCWITFFLDVLQQLVQKSFARLYFNDYLRNSRLVSSCLLLSLSFVNQTVRKTYLLNIFIIFEVFII